MSFRAVASLLLGSVTVAGAAAGAVASETSTTGTHSTAPAVTVPDVVGLPALKAAYRLEAAHLEAVCREADGADRRGTVVEQRPAAGTSVSPGSVVTIFSGDDNCSPFRQLPGATSSPSPTTTTGTAARTAKTAPLDPIPSGATVRTVNVAFVSLTVGYVLVSASTGKRCELAIEKTTNGGTTLGTPVPVAPCAEFAQGVSEVKLAFDDHGDGFVYEGRSFYATHDGGSTWRAVPEPGDVADVGAVGSSVWMFVGQCKTPSCWLVLMESTDGGASWSQSPEQPPILVTTTDPELVRVSTLSAYVLTAPRRDAFGEPDTVPMWSTTDGGRSWVQHDLPCPIDSGDAVVTATHTGKLFAVCAAEPAAGSQPKSVLVSTDGGATWSAPEACTTTILDGRCTAKTLLLGYLGTLDAPAPTVVYLTGPRSAISRSSDGGATWTRVGGTPGTGNVDLTFFNEEDGLALSQSFAAKPLAN